MGGSILNKRIAAIQVGGAAVAQLHGGDTRDHPAQIYRRRLMQIQIAFFLMRSDGKQPEACAAGARK